MILEMSRVRVLGPIGQLQAVLGKVQDLGLVHLIEPTESESRETLDQFIAVMRTIAEEAKEELKESIEFLKNPTRIQRLGGHMPKGLLLLGSPGTGKTTVIAAAVEALVARGMRVLVAAGTNTAVDNILARLVTLGVDFLRLGGIEPRSPLRSRGGAS